jgi:hypothetical protein
LAKLYQELSIRNDDLHDLFWMAQAQQLSKLADNDGGILAHESALHLPRRRGQLLFFENRLTAQ